MQFEYLEPMSIDEAVSLLVEHRNEAKLIAGGTDLIVQIRRGKIRPRYLINIGFVPGLSHVRYDGAKGLEIGALTTIQALQMSSEIERKHPVIAQAASQLGSVAIRNVASLGGNLCNAAPSADMAPALIALSAAANIVGPSGERTILLDDFFTGPGSTVLGTGEMLKEVLVPSSPPHTGGAYFKHEIRKSIDLAIASVAAIITLADDKSCSDARIVLGAVAPTPMRARRAEEILRGRVIDEALVLKCAEVAAGEARPISDVRASAEYRREMVRVFTKYAVRKALENATKAKEDEGKR